MQLLYEKNATIGVYFFYPQLLRAVFSQKNNQGPSQWEAPDEYNAQED